MSAYNSPLLDLSVFSNNMFKTPSSSGNGGTITAVLPGTNLTGGGTSGSVSLDVNVNTIAEKS